MTITPPTIQAQDGMSGSRRTASAGAGVAGGVPALVAGALDDGALDDGAPDDGVAAAEGDASAPAGAAPAVKARRPETGCPSSEVTRHSTE